MSTYGMRQLERKLMLVSDDIMPKVTSYTLDNLAFTARRESVKNVKSGMTLRRPWTLQTIQLDKSNPSSSIDKQFSETGSIAEYMRVQEESGWRLPKRGRSTPLVTNVAAGQPRNQRPRTRVGRPQYKLSRLRRIDATKMTVGKNVGQRNRIAVSMAAENGVGFVHMQTRKGRAIFQVLGSKDHAQLTMLWNFNRSKLFIPKNEWLSPAVDKALTRRDEFFIRSMNYHFKRLW